MYIETTDSVQSTVMTLQHMLRKIDHLCLPPASRRDLESILVRQVTRELDRLLPWQVGHGEGTAAVALQIGQAVHLTDEELHQLKLASLLHDIGILMLPLDLQTQREWLEPDSYVAIQNHPRLGAMLLEPFSFLHDATVMIAHHHERWDGSGYPYGLRGEFIPLGARILAVADAFDAIQVPHVQDHSLRDRIALRILRIASGTQFDPAVVDIVVDLFQETEAVRMTTTHDRAHSRRLPYAGFKVGGPPLPLDRQGSSPPEDPCRP